MPKIIKISIFIVIVIAIALAGFFLWPNKATDVPDGGDNQTGEIDTSNWKTYTNEEYGFEFKYPESFKLSSLDIIGNLIPFDSHITSNIQVVQSNLNEIVFSVYIKENGTLSPTWVSMQSDALKPAILQPLPATIIIDGVLGYKIIKGTIAITTDFPKGTKYTSDQYFLQKTTEGPIINLIIPCDVGGQIFSTFKFIK